MNEPSENVRRVQVLREELRRQGISGFIIPHADEYQNEYTPDYAERLAWLTGFTGSAGTAVLLEETGAIFVDGRYVVQVDQQVDRCCFVPHHSADSPVYEWLPASLNAGQKLGFDPWLHTPREVEKLRVACEQAGASLVACEKNPVDVVWSDRPAIPLSPAVLHPMTFTGKDSTAKREELAKTLKDQSVDAAVVTAPDSLAWLLNIRGRDVAYTPVCLCMGIIGSDGSMKLFIEPQKVTSTLSDGLGPMVSIHPFQSFGPELDRLGEQKLRVMCDPTKSASWVFERLTKSSAVVVHADDPCALPKACKNQIEAEGARASHQRDGAALCRFLAWLARESLGGKVTEMEAAEYLDGCRRNNELWQDLSFPTISGAGPNGAIIHYRSTLKTNAVLTPNSLYLVDSGAQYLDGTTDVTRTIAIGTPTAEHRDRYTRVLQGHIALATARFPKGTTGSQLDVLARKALWEVGLDYDHGTGHGVGSYLGVHEGPQRISKMGGGVALQPGMIVSNEPGYYKPGSYGIRIENLVIVVECAEVQEAERDLLSFETLTLAPFDRNLIDRSLLHQHEVNWIDGYHTQVRTTLTPLVDQETADWLHQATLPL